MPCQAPVLWKPPNPTLGFWGQVQTPRCDREAWLGPVEHPGLLFGQDPPAPPPPVSPPSSCLSLPSYPDFPGAMLGSLSHPPACPLCFLPAGSRGGAGSSRAVSSPEALAPYPAMGGRRRKFRPRKPSGGRTWLGPVKAVPFPALTWSWGGGAAHQSVLGVSVMGVAVLVDGHLQPQGVGVAHHCLVGGGGWGRRRTPFTGAGGHRRAPLGSHHRGPLCPFALKTELALQRQPPLRSPCPRPTSSTPQRGL